MRCHAHRLTAHRHIDVGRSKTHGQIGWDPTAETQSEIMARPTIGRYAGDAEFAVRSRGNGLRALPQRFEHPRDRPFRQKLERGFGHRHQRKIAALADIEPARAGLKFVAVVDEAREILGILAGNPIVLDGATALPARGHVKKAEAVWPE